MKKIIVVPFVIIMLCGCSALDEQESAAISTTESTTNTEIKETIPPFEKEEREILSLPEEEELSDDPMELVDTLIDNYEAIHFTEFETDFELCDMQLEKIDEGYIITSQKANNETMTSDVGFSKPLNEYFNTPDNSYGILVRFKTENADEIMFNYESKFGRIMLDFTDGIYPAIDVAGDFYGDPMCENDCNNYAYTSGEWAYVFLTITNVGQKSCYIWAETNPENNNFYTSYGVNDGGENPYKFNFEVYSEGESITISDIWLYSYGRLKR